MAAQDSTLLVDEWLDLWNGDYRPAQKIIDPDFRMHAAMMDGGSGGDLRGSDGLVGWIRQLRAAIPDLRFVVEVGPIAEDDYVSLRWAANGNYGGGFPGATAPAGTPISITGTDTLRIKDGRFVEYWLNSDVHILLAQLQVKTG